MGDERNTAFFFGKIFAEGQTGCRTVNAHAVWPKQTDAVILGNLHYLFFQLRACYRAVFSETGGVAMHKLNAFRGAIPHRLRRSCGRNIQNDVANRIRDITDIGIGGQALDLFDLWINGVDPAGVAKVL